MEQENSICKRCEAWQLMMKFQKENLENFRKVLELESQLESLGVRPCTKENGAVIINFKQYVI